MTREDVDESGAPNTDPLTAPLGDLIAAVGQGVADAQRALDAQTIESVRALSDPHDPLAKALVEVGYVPKWYTIPEVDAEIVVSLSVTQSTTTAGHGDGRTHMSLAATPVDANFVNRYNYNLSAVSRLRFKIRPVPAAEGSENLRAVPDLLAGIPDTTSGRRPYQYWEAEAELTRLGLGSEAADGSETPKGEVIGQSPKAGDLVRIGSVVTLTVTTAAIEAI